MVYKLCKNITQRRTNKCAKIPPIPPDPIVIDVARILNRIIIETVVITNISVDT